MFIHNSLYGVSITIQHSNDVSSVYSSISDVSLKINDTVAKGEVIGKASTSVEDEESKVHVHLEVLVKGNFVNPLNVYGKELNDLTNDK